MKPNIHPEYHMITVVMTDGTEFVTRSTWGKPGGRLQLDIDPKTHHAWIGGAQQVLERGAQIMRFKNRFGSLSFNKTAPNETVPSETAPNETEGT